MRYGQNDHVEAQESFVVEYACNRHCRIEIDAEKINTRAGRRQMRDLADREHDRVHPPSKPRERKPPTIRKPVVSSPFLR